jgi:hypothetical protein
MAKSVVFIALGILVAIIAGVGFNLLNPEFMRYEVAINSITGKPCYIRDWKAGKNLPVSMELLSKADGSFYCDPSQCK